jgi:hypothetical protein
MRGARKVAGLWAAFAPGIRTFRPEAPVDDASPLCPTLAAARPLLGVT